jgi:hypothetical protein
MAYWRSIHNQPTGGASRRFHLEKTMPKKTNQEVINTLSDDTAGNSKAGAPRHSKERAYPTCRLSGAGAGITPVAEEEAVLFRPRLWLVPED